MTRTIPRHISSLVGKADGMFSTIVTTGPRQVGKSTLLRTMFPEIPYITLDSIVELEAAKTNPDGYLKAKRLPSIIDEIQYAPDLFHSIKIAVDEAKLVGDRRTLIYATGSQRLEMLEGASESLAGRAYVLEMLGLSQREIAHCDFMEPFYPTVEYIKKREQAGRIPPVESIWNTIVRGDMPELIAVPDIDTHMFYDAYLNTYIKRDVRKLAHVGDEAAFMRFMRVAASQVGRQINKASIARDLDISESTVNRWLSVLEASGIIYTLKPYFKSIKKQLVKTPKLYFTNTGLACHLCGITSSEALASSTFSGHLFENYIICEILKSHLNATGSYPSLYYYRDTGGKEIDLLMPSHNGLHPIEVKAKENPNPQDGKRFSLIETVLGEKQLPGAIISRHEAVLPLVGDNIAIPFTMI